MKKTCPLNRLSVTLAIFIFVFCSLPKHIFAVNIGLENGSSWGGIEVSFGTTIPSSIPNEAITYFNSFSGQKPYFKISDPSPSLLTNSNFQVLDSDGSLWYFSFSDTQNASQFLSTYAKQAVVEIRNYDQNSLSALKKQFPQIKLHTPGENWTSGVRTQEIMKALPPPKLDAYSFQFVDSDTLNDYSWVTVIGVFNLLFDTGNCLACIGDYPANSKVSITKFDFNSTTGYREDRASSYEAGIFSISVTNSVQMQQRADFAPLRYILWRDFTNLSIAEKNILYYFVDFAAKSQSLAWPMAHPANGDPFNSAKPVIGVIGKRSDGYYVILTNTEGGNTSVNLSGVNLSGYKYYSTVSGSGSFSGGSNISLSGFETIVAAPTLGEIPPIPSQPPVLPTGITPTSTTYPLPSTGLSATPPAGFFSSNFKIMGQIITGDVYQPQAYWQSGNYCGTDYQIQNMPVLNINSYQAGRLLSSNLCNPEPYYIFDYYEAGKHKAAGPVTLTLKNLPAGYFCTGWTWLSDYDDQSGTGCQLTADFRLFPPYAGTFREPGFHHVSFYIKEGSPTATTAPGQPTPTRSPITPSPVPSATITPPPVIGTVQFMMLKLGRVSPKQSLSTFRDILISFFDWLSWLRKNM